MKIQEVITILSLLIGISCLAAERAMQLPEALQLALEKSPEYKTFILQERNAGLSSTNAWRSLLPTLDLQAGNYYGQQNNSSYITAPIHSPWSSRGGATITENLYDNGETWRNAEIADLNLRLQLLKRLSGRAKILIGVSKAFYDYSAAAALVGLREQQLQTLRTQFSTIESHYRQGLSSNRDYLRIKTQVQSAEISLLTQKNQVDQAKASLRVVLGTAELVEFEPLSEQTAIPAWAAANIDGKNSIPFQISEVQSQIAQLKLKSASRIEWPKLSLKGSYNYVVPQYWGSRIDGVDDPYWNLQVSLVLDYRLWDWGNDSRTVIIAENQRFIEENTQQIERIRVTHDLQQLQLQIQKLRESYNLTQQILKAYQEAYSSLSRDYRDGKVSYLELITALNDYYGSLSQDINLRFSLMKLRLDLAYYEGNVDEVLKTN